MLSHQFLSRQLVLARRALPAAAAARWTTNNPHHPPSSLGLTMTTTPSSSSSSLRRHFSASAATGDELSEARQKLTAVMEEYRHANYTQTLFSRFVKEMIQATDKNHDGKITVHEMQQMLKNIGIGEDKGISLDDLQAIFKEIGSQEYDENGEPLIYADEMETILTASSKKKKNSE